MRITIQQFISFMAGGALGLGAGIAVVHVLGHDSKVTDWVFKWWLK